MKPVRCLLMLPLVIPTSTLATEPLIVRNPDKPLWDRTHHIEFKENLRIGGEDDEDVVFGQIVSIAADSKGRVIVGDHNQNLVRRFGADGQLLGVIGRGGDGPGEYRNVWEVATDAKDNVYIAGQGRISIFDGSGTFVREFMDDSHEVVRDIRVLTDGGILVSELDFPTKSALQIYMDGKHAAHFGDIHKFPDDIALNLMGWVGGFADTGPDGMIYYTQMFPYEVRKFTPSGELVMRILRENDFVELPKIEQKGEWTSMSGGCGSFGIFVLPDGRFINKVIGIDTTILDLFDKDGRLLFSQRAKEAFSPEWLDARGDGYDFDRKASAVVRARMAIH